MVANDSQSLCIVARYRSDFFDLKILNRNDSCKTVSDCVFALLYTVSIFSFFFRRSVERLFLTPYHVPLLLSHVETFETIITGSGFRCFFINTPSWEMIQFDGRICFKWVVKIPPPMKYEVEAPYFCCNESIRCFATCPYLQTSNESNENPGSCKTIHERWFFWKRL